MRFSTTKISDSILSCSESNGSKRKKIEETTTVTTVNDEETKSSTRFKLLSWNIDGLDEQENTIETRTHGVIDVIKR